MKKRPFQEQLSKFSLLGQLPKVETGLEEAWKNLKKCTEPFTAQDIIKQQQETINRQKEEIEALVAGQETLQKNLAKAIKSEAKKEFAEELIYKIVNTPTKFESTYYMYREGIAFRQNEIIDIIKEMAGDIK